MWYTYTMEYYSAIKRSEVQRDSTFSCLKQIFKLRHSLVFLSVFTATRNNTYGYILCTRHCVQGIKSIALINRHRSYNTDVVVVKSLKSCPTLCDHVDCSTPGFTIFQSLLKLMSIESVIPHNHLIFCHLPFLLPSICPIIKVFSNES